MKMFRLAAVMLALASGPALAKNFAIPADDPIATIQLPDDWKPSEIDYGTSAVSPDKDVFFSVEYAGGKDVDGMTALNESWLKENKIKLLGDPQKGKDNLNGLDADLLLYEATDEDGPTRVTFGFVSAGKGRVIMLTLWASAEQRKAHSAEIAAILSSIKPIN